VTIPDFIAAAAGGVGVVLAGGAVVVLQPPSTMVAIAKTTRTAQIVRKLLFTRTTFPYPQTLRPYPSW